MSLDVYISDIRVYVFARELSGLAANAVLSHEGVEIGPLNAGFFRSFCDVPVVSLQSLKDKRPLNAISCGFVNAFSQLF